MGVNSILVLEIVCKGWYMADLILSQQLHHIGNCFAVIFIVNIAAIASTPRFVKVAILCPCMYIPNCDRQSTCVNALACQKCLIKTSYSLRLSITFLLINCHVSWQRKLIALETIFSFNIRYLK